MKGELTLGIDLGGTKIMAVVADGRHKILSTNKSQTTLASDPVSIAEQIIETGRGAVEALKLEWKDIRDIGVAVPSPVDPKTGDCLHSPNLGLKNYSLKGHFRKYFKKDVYLENDGNCGMLGEFYCGAARKFDSAVGFFVGTGLGGGIVMNGRLLTGNGGIAAEFGHMIVRQGGRRCNCGNRGCAEAYASKAGFFKAFQKRILEGGEQSLVKDRVDWETGKIKSKHLASAYAKGDKVVRETLDEGMRVLGATAATVCAVVAPECIVFGGGVMGALGRELFPVIEESFRDNLFGLKPSRIKLKLAALDDHSVALGATVLASKKGGV